MPFTSFGKGGNDTDGLDPALRDFVGLASPVDNTVECSADDFEVAPALVEIFCFADVFAGVAGGLVRVGDAADVVVGVPTSPSEDELGGSGVVILGAVVDGFGDVDPTVRGSSLFVTTGTGDPVCPTVSVGDGFAAYDATADDSPRGSTAIATATRAAIATAASTQRRR